MGATDPHQEEDRIEIGHRHRGVGPLLDHRLGVEGDPQTGYGQHVEIVGPVTHRHHLRRADALGGSDLFEKSGLARSVDEFAGQAPGEDTVLDVEGVGQRIIDAQLGSQVIGEPGEAGGDDGGLHPHALQRPDEGAGSGGNADPRRDPTQSLLVETFEQGYPLSQRPFEVDLPSQGRGCDLGHPMADTSFLGEQVDHLVLDECRVDVEDHQSLGSPLQALGLNGDVNGAVGGKDDELFPDLVDVATRHRQFVGDHRIAGEPEDAFDVAPALSDGAGHGAEVVRTDSFADDGHHCHVLDGHRLCVHLLELDVQALLPSEQEQITNSRFVPLHTDEDVEVESPPDHYLLDVEHLGSGGVEHLHETGRDAGVIGAVNGDQYRGVGCHRWEG